MQLTKSTHIIREGNLDYRLNIHTNDEIQDLMQSFNLMVEKLKSTRKELEDSNINLERQVEKRTIDLQQEINERKKSFEALQESEERYRCITQSTIDGILSADAKGNIVSWNKGAENIFGYKGDEIIGIPITKLMPEKFRIDHLKGLQDDCGAYNK